jgi:hypothetical protein
VWQVPHGCPVCRAKLGSASAGKIVPNVTAQKTKPNMHVADAAIATLNNFCGCPMERFRLLARSIPDPNAYFSLADFVL